MSARLPYDLFEELIDLVVTTDIDIAMDISNKVLVLPDEYRDTFKTHLTDIRQTMEGQREKGVAKEQQERAMAWYVGWLTTDAEEHKVAVRQ